MRTWTNKRILITQSSLFSIAGSEVVAYELAGFFAGKGAQVTVVTCGFSGTWEEHFSTLPNTTLLRLDDPCLDARITADPPDYAWIQHQVIPVTLLRNPGSTIFLFHHMSAFLPQEFPLDHRVESALASAVLFPAQESLEVQRASGLLEEVSHDRLAVLGNPAPEHFWVPSPPTRTRMRRVLLVSNHIPEELAAAISSLPPDCEVVVRGEERSRGAVSQLVQPEELAGADTIISIGKTVQYALAAGVPVYCYDRFGGPGWLGPDNVVLARHNNFSGRGFASRSAEDIAAELHLGFAKAAIDAAELHRTIGPEFLLNVAIERVLSTLKPHSIRPLSEPDLVAFGLRQEVTNGLTNALAARNMTVTAHEMTIDDVYTRLSLSEAKAAQLDTEVLRLTAEVQRIESVPGLRMARVLRNRFIAVKTRLMGRASR